MDKTKELIEKYFTPIYLILLIGAALMYLTLAFGRGTWVDEAYTMAMIRHGFADMCRITAADVHPPLYYILLKLFMLPFGSSMAAARCFSAIPYILILAFGSRQLKKLFNPSAAVLFMLIFILFPFTMNYSVEIRMYSLSAMFVFFCAVFAYRSFLYNGVKDWTLFALFGTGAAYTHYFALVSAGIIYALLLGAVIIKKRLLLPRCAVFFILTVILYIPWLKSLIEQLVYKVNNDYWISPITLRTILGYAHSVFGAGGILIFCLFSFAAYAAVFLYALIKGSGKLRATAAFSLIIPVGTAAIGIGASLIVRPVFVIRYIIPAIPVFLAGAAVILSEIKAEAAVSAFLTFTLMGGISQYGANLIGTYRIDENQITSDFAEKYSGCDAYVIIGNKVFGATHLSGTLACFESKIPIYRETRISAANPYENMRCLEDFDVGAFDTVTLILQEGFEIPPELSDAYNFEYGGKAASGSYIADVYILTK